MVALSGIDEHLAVHNLGDLNGAGSLHLALLAALTFFSVHSRVPLTDDGQVVQFRLDAVVGAAAHGDLKLVGQLYIMVADVVQPV